VGNYAAAETAKIYAFGLLLCGLLGLAEAPLYAGQPPPDEELPPISIETDQPAGPSTHKELERKFHDALKRRPSAAEERRLADGTLEITTQLGHFCAKPLPAQAQSGVGGNIALAAPCATF